MQHAVGLALLALAGLLPARLTAQSIHGVVVDRSDTPVAGVVVLLVDSALNVSARSLSSARGEFRLAASLAGTYRVRTLRIGFRPVTSAPVKLSAGEDVTQRIVLSGVAFSLDTVRVLARNTCHTVVDSAAATFAVWEQVRTALTATQLSEKERAITATMIGYEQSLDRNSQRVRQQSASVRSALVAQPWHSLSPDSLHRSGYVAMVDDSTAYYAPGIDVLLSNEFLDDHCFQLASSPDSTRLGIAFEPISERKNVAEIRGTLWLDRKSSELRSIDFHYANISREQEQRAGGAMELVRMRDGTWAISRWSIRMPVLAKRRLLGTAISQIVVAEMRVSGGDLSLAVRGADTLWSRPPLSLSGTVVDSASGEGLAGAYITLMGTRLAAVSDSGGRFIMPSVLPGKYTAEIHTTLLDEIGAVNQTLVSFTDSAVPVHIRVPSAQQIGSSLCGVSEPLMKGIIVGTVEFRGDTASPANVRIFAAWKTADMYTGAPATGRSDRQLQTRSDSAGRYRLCGVPVKTTLFVRAVEDSADSEPASVMIENGIFGRADLVVDRFPSRGATFTGMVMLDSTRTPIADAEVSLTDLSLSERTNERGVFHFSDIPAGTHSLVVRKFGHGPLETKITFAANRTLERDVFLTRIVTLDSMKVVAERPVIPSFDENRKHGFGRFLTRADLEKHPARRLGDLLSTFPGTRIVGRAPNAYLASSRGRKSLTGARSCLSQVYLDHMVMYGRPGAPPFDINSITQDQIEAIEYYASAAVTPLEHSALNSQCGVLVIWTRR
ncbi:MAG: carboxypeptidase regulatory-like domain-containing protein [bacterium]